jgi:hypothetical protein
MTLAVVDFDAPGSPDRRVRLDVPARFAVGTVTRLTGPSPPATQDVQLGGAEVAPNGTWVPTRSSHLTTVPGRPLSVQMAASSAALVTLSSAGATPYR